MGLHPLRSVQIYGRGAACMKREAGPDKQLHRSPDCYLLCVWHAAETQAAAPCGCKYWGGLGRKHRTARFLKRSTA